MIMQYITNATSSTALDTYTFAARPLGSAVTGTKTVIIVAGARASGSGDPLIVASVQVAGATASIAVQRENRLSNTNVLSISAVPLSATLTAGDVVVKYNRVCLRSSLGIYMVPAELVLHDADSTEDFTDNAFSVAVDTAADGVAIGAYFSNAGGSADWTGHTADYASNVSNARTSAVGISTNGSPAVFSGGWSSGTLLNPVAVAASWILAGEPPSGDPRRRRLLSAYQHHTRSRRR